MLADREFDEAVIAELEGALKRVKEIGTGGTLERYHKRLAHFLFKVHYIDIGEGDMARRVYALTHIILSTDAPDVVQASDEIAAIIETEL